MTDGDRQPPRRKMPQHVWVDVTGAFAGPHTYPGILLEWRPHTPIQGKREALVSYAEGDAHGWQMVTRWLLAEHVRQAK